MDFEQIEAEVVKAIKAKWPDADIEMKEPGEYYVTCGVFHCQILFGD